MDSNLEEKNFFHEGLRSNPGPFLFWLMICVLATFSVWYLSSRAIEEKELVYGSTPYLQVTNRAFSLFLWQNPEFMKQNLKSNRHYLTAWSDREGDRLTPLPEDADQWVDAPDEALFMYHTWNRLLGDYYYPRDISQAEFLKFLEADPQWHPKYWRQAPDAYRTLISWIEGGSQYEDLKEVSYQELPKIVRQAFLGWKNYTFESSKINSVRPTYRQLWTFIDYYPNFKRPLWINLVKETKPQYLKESNVKGFDLVPEEEMDGLLQMGIYNYLVGTAKNPSL